MAAFRCSQQRHTGVRTGHASHAGDLMNFVTLVKEENTLQACRAAHSKAGGGLRNPVSLGTEWSGKCGQAEGGEGRW
jgi:hypothetical protein